MRGLHEGDGHPAREPTRPTALSERERAAHFRPDIEGLRGIAVLMVVLFHAMPGLLGGGFIGVDVFFVISGFLITGLLVRELDRNGRVALGSFYVRRVRRLLPAAALAIGVTLLLSALVVPPLDLPRIAGDGVSAALSVSNIRFALAAGDYFSAIDAPSPFLQFWSLSVEEQFYLVWPALLIVAFRIARGPRGVAIAVALVALLSLLAAVVLTDMAPNWAFFSLLTRAWQLALGGLLALTAIGIHRARWLSAPLALVGWLGLGAVFLAGAILDGELAYPGLWALLPTLGAVAIIGAGDGRFGPGLLLRTAPLRFLGRISYPLYLWHWPLLVLSAIAFGGELPLVARIGLVGLAVLIATASTVFVEEPIRRGPIRMSGRRQLAVVGTLGMALLFSVTVGVAAVTWVTQEAISESRRAAVVLDGSDGSLTASAGSSEPGDAVVEMDADSGTSRAGAAAGAAASPKAPSPKKKRKKKRTPRPTAAIEAQRATLAPARTAPPTKKKPKPEAKPKAKAKPKPKAKPRPTPRPRPTRPNRTVVALPADVRPPLWKASEDEELLRRNGCLESEKATKPKRCVFGDTSSKFVVALLGDSHASHWFPALSKVARDRGWRLLTFVKVSCPFTDIPVRNLRLKRVYRECAQFNENTVAALQRIKPDLVVTSLFRFQYPTRSSDGSAEAQGAGIARMLNRLSGEKVVIADTPFAGVDVPACLSKNLKDVRRCAVASFRRTSGGSPARERIAAKRSGGAFLNFGSTICGRNDGCPVVSNGMIVFRDEHHLTATYSRWLAPAMDRALMKILRRGS